jgi:hypothetical protein
VVRTVDPEEIPDISSADSGERCTIILIVLAMLFAIPSLGYSYANPSIGYAVVSIIAGLSAIAVAILTAGRRISDSK